MPLRPDVSGGLNLTRRATTPVKLPKMNFPMLGGVAPDTNPQHYAPPDAVEGTVPLPEEEMPVAPSHMERPAMPMSPAPAPSPAPAAREAARVIVYGRSNCAAVMDAIADLMSRQINFTYFDVGRDATAMSHLNAICGGEPVVPVIIHVGFGGA